MTERTAAEIRALREQEYDLWQTNRNISIQQTPPIKSTIIRSQNGHDAEYRMGIAHTMRTSPYRYQSTPRTQMQEADPILALITFSSIAVGCFALIVGVIKGCK